MISRVSSGAPRGFFYTKSVKKYQNCVNSANAFKLTWILKTEQFRTWLFSNSLTAWEILLHKLQYIPLYMKKITSLISLLTLQGSHKTLQVAINFKYDLQDNFHLWSDISGHLVKLKLSFFYNQMYSFDDFFFLSILVSKIPIWKEAMLYPITI